MTEGSGTKLTPEEGTKSIRKCLFDELAGNGWYYGSDGERSPLVRARDPGEPAFDGTDDILPTSSDEQKE